MSIYPPSTMEELRKIDLEIAMREQEVERLIQHRKEFVNRHNLNKLEDWPSNERIENIGRNGDNNGKGHYE